MLKSSMPLRAGKGSAAAILPSAAWYFRGAKGRAREQVAGPSTAATHTAERGVTAETPSSGISQPSLSGWIAGGWQSGNVVQGLRPDRRTRRVERQYGRRWSGLASARGKGRKRLTRRLHWWSEACDTFITSRLGATLLHAIPRLPQELFHTALPLAESVYAPVH